MVDDLEERLLDVIARKLSVREPDLLAVEGGEAGAERVRQALDKLEQMDLVQRTDDPITNRPLYSPTARGMIQSRRKASKALF